MCARKIIATSLDELEAIFGVTHRLIEAFTPRWNLPVTEREPVVRIDESGSRTLELATWDYRDSKVTTLKGRTPFYNARGETMSKSLAFAERRCLVPVDGFYEWMMIDGKKQPIVFRREDSKPFAMAGVWSEWTDPKLGKTMLTYVELTVGSGALVGPIHNRMPLILEPESWSAYLEQSVEAARSLVRPNDMRGYIRYPVSTRVNSVKAEGVELVERVGMPEAQSTLFG